MSVLQSTCGLRKDSAADGPSQSPVGSSKSSSDFPGEASSVAAEKEIEQHRYKAPWWRLSSTPELPETPRTPLDKSSCTAEVEAVPKATCIAAPSRQRLAAIETFLDLMHSHGDGSVALAWRRYFDKENGSPVTFRDFCSVLSTLGFQQNAVDLWHALSDESKDSNHMGLEVFDPHSAKLIAEFQQWCQRAAGGPLQAFHAADVTGAGLLTRHELLAGLRWLGLFDEKFIPWDLRCEDAFLKHMYPLIDPWNRGRVSEDSFLFLEQDISKKRRHPHKISRGKHRAQKDAPQCKDTMPPKPPSMALNLLSNFSRRSQLGRDIDKYLQPAPEQLEALARHAREKPRRRRQMASHRSSSTPELPGLPPPASQDAAATAAAVLAEVASAQESYVSLPRLTLSGARSRSQSGVRSCSQSAADSEFGCQHSVAASSVAATRKGMRRLYKAKLEGQLPPVKGPCMADRDLRAALTGADCHRRQLDAAMNPKRHEDLLSQNFERALFERYYA